MDVDTHNTYSNRKPLSPLIKSNRRHQSFLIIWLPPTQATSYLWKKGMQTNYSPRCILNPPLVADFRNIPMPRKYAKTSQFVLKMLIKTFGKRLWLLRRSGSCFPGIIWKHSIRKKVNNLNLESRATRRRGASNVVDTSGVLGTVSRTRDSHSSDRIKTCALI